MNDTQQPTPSLNEPATYEIRLKGHLPQRWAGWFGDAAIRLQEDGVTVLTCPALDQAALHGLLRKARDLGLPLVSVNPVRPDLADLAKDKP